MKPFIGLLLATLAGIAVGQFQVWRLRRRWRRDDDLKKARRATAVVNEEYRNAVFWRGPPK